MNLLLSAFSDFWSGFIARVTMPAMIVAIVFAIFGVAFAVIAKSLTKAIRKTDEIKDNDSIYIGSKIAGLVCLFVAIMIIVFKGF